MSDKAEDGTATVAVIQGNVPRAGLDFNAQRRAVLDYHARETQRLAAEVKAGKEPQPDFVLWPENSSDIDPYANPDAARGHRGRGQGDRRARLGRRGGRTADGKLLQRADPVGPGEGPDATPTTSGRSSPSASTFRCAG